MKRTVFIILGLAIIGGGGWLAYNAMKDDNQANTPTTAQESETPETTTPEEQPEPTLSFTNPKKSAHYVSNTPEHASILQRVPNEVVLNFNFDLAENSTISITKDDKEYGNGAVSFAADKLSMRMTVLNSGGSGVYNVSYNACWPDGSCHNGQFQFGVK